MAHAEPTRVFAPFTTPLANVDVVDIRPALKIRPRRTSSLRVAPHSVHANGKAIGAVWVVSHTEDRKFDQEDQRLVRELSVLQRGPATDRGAARAVDIIARQSQHMSRLTDDLLDIERIESGKRELDRRPVDLRAVVAGTIDARRAQIERRGHCVTVQLGDAPLIIELVKSLAELHGGAVTVVSEGRDRGISFYVRLPMRHA